MLKARCFCLCLCVALCPAARAADLSGKIIRIGYRAAGIDRYALGNDHFRVGRWVPIVVELTNHDPDLFQGHLEARQEDRDGDEAVGSRDVSVEKTREYTVYVPAGRSLNADQFSVRVYDLDGELVPLRDDAGSPTKQIIPPLLPVSIPRETRMILDISQRPITQLNDLISSDGLDPKLVIARGSTAELPDNVAGLDMVDVIVWDGADPSAIDLAQRQPLEEWVRRGGKLVLGVSRNWSLVSQSRFGALLPARLSEVTTTQSISEEMADLLGLDGTSLRSPLTHCPVTRTSLVEGATPFVPEEPAADEWVLVSRRACGRGEIVLVSAELWDVLEPARNRGAFLRRLFEVRGQAEESQGMMFGMGGLSTDLFTFVEGVMGFQVASRLYFLLAFVFVATYIALTTAGSWAWLKRKSMTQHAWSAYAAGAAAASVASLAAVALIRGISVDAQELAIVDGRANEPNASATCYVGFKTASHMDVDLQFPTNWFDLENSPEAPASLMPLPPTEEFGEEDRYAAGGAYDAVAPNGELWRVPMRATLKEFEGTWSGQLNGQLKASLRQMKAGSYELTLESWIRNELGTDLRQCYLFVAQQNVSDRFPDRSRMIFVYPMETVGDKERMTIDQSLGIQLKKRRRTEPGAKEAIIPQLNNMHSEWLRPLGVRFQSDGYGGSRSRERTDALPFENALLVLTTFQEIARSELEYPEMLERSVGAEIDRSSAILKHQALFVGFADGPGPTRLCWRSSDGWSQRWRPVEPSTSRVMYRFVIPVEPALK